MTTHACNNAEAQHLRERRVQKAQAMRATGASAVLISRAIGVGIATTRKYLAQGVIDEECKPKKPTSPKKRTCLRCRYDFKPPHSGRFICSECTKTIARMG